MGIEPDTLMTLIEPVHETSGRTTTFVAPSTATLRRRYAGMRRSQARQQLEQHDRGSQEQVPASEVLTRGKATTTDYSRQRRYADFEDYLELYSGQVLKHAHVRQRRSAFTAGSFHRRQRRQRGKYDAKVLQAGRGRRSQYEEGR
eukprot:9470173-Pyramimonas_sp.AAC.1